GGHCGSPFGSGGEILEVSRRAARRETAAPRRRGCGRPYGSSRDEFRSRRRSLRAVTPVPPARHLLRAKDLVDARYWEPLDVPALARAARLSPAHFSREFRRAFGETPHQYVVSRRLERAAALLRTTDRSVA